MYEKCDSIWKKEGKHLKLMIYNKQEKSVNGGKR